MASSGNDLFAGLSLAPSSSSKNEKISESKNVGYTPPTPPSPNGGNGLSIAPPPATGSSPTTDQQNRRLQTSPSTTISPPLTMQQTQPPPRVQNAPVTDKLLSLLGESSPNETSSTNPVILPPSPASPVAKLTSVKVAVSSNRATVKTSGNDSVPLPQARQTMPPAKFTPAAKKRDEGDEKASSESSHRNPKERKASITSRSRIFNGHC